MNEKELNARLDTLEVLAESYGFMDLKNRIKKLKNADSLSVIKEIENIEKEIRRRIGR